MLLVLDCAASAEAVLSALGENRTRVSLFLEASPPLIALPELPSSLCAALSAVPGVRHTLSGEQPVLSSRRLIEDAREVSIGGGVVFGGRDVHVIAGPCSIDEEEHLLGVAHAVRAAGATLLRGGAFKGRTSPYAFQGLGERALPMLARARAETGLPVVTEVLSEEGVEPLGEVADALQVGARNMHNTALLKRLGRLRKPVLLKRGFGSTIHELLLAAEYILAGGNADVILCERGIRTFERGVRFSFDLSAFARLKEETRLPVVVDPSHAVGDAHLVGTVARAAIAAGADGLLVEVHDHPERAASDGDQTLDPAAFLALMNELRPVAVAVGRTMKGLVA